MEKPGRPLGVSLAIVMSVIWFSVLPLLQVGLVLLIHQRFQNIDFASSGVQPVATGGDFLGVPIWMLAFQAAFGAAFLIVAVFAWRGRPRWMRQALPGAVGLLTGVILIFTLQQAFSQPDLQAGISSVDGTSLLKGDFLGSLLLMLFVIWYMNRGPARAFYRGYYLSHPEESSREPEQPLETP
ncbi:MAG: hypothetical protein H6672_10635 [Anaerolineaceae bacterium]|nr:hypothetical protein [Anaerolineaceae bacterium]